MFIIHFDNCACSQVHLQQTTLDGKFSNPHVTVPKEDHTKRIDRLKRGLILHTRALSIPFYKTKRLFDPKFMHAVKEVVLQSGASLPTNSASKKMMHDFGREIVCTR